MSSDENTQTFSSVLADLVPTAESDRLIQLLVCLMHARKAYDPAAADHGRSAVYEILLGLIEHISQIVPTRPDLVYPLRDLLCGLRGLDDGSIAPLLKGAEIKGRRSSPITQELFRADAAALMQLMQWQGVERETAAGNVARDLNKLGYGDDGYPLDRKGVVLWRNKMKKPVDPACCAAAHYRNVLAELEVRFPKDPKSAYRFLLGLMLDLDTPWIPSKSSV